MAVQIYGILADTKIGGMAFTVVRNSSPRTEEQRAAILAAPGFGQYFTDHLVRIDWTAEHGWSPGQVLPYAPLALDPATMSLHYGQEIFEGLKAYHQPDGSVATFRPEMNAARFARSARRLAMPELPAELFLGVAARARRRRPRMGTHRPDPVAVPAGRS